MWNLHIVVVFWCIIEERWNWIHVGKGITIVYSTERVPSTLSSERSFIWTCENGPVTWCGGIWKLVPNVFGISLYYWMDISICASFEEAIRGVDKVSGDFWPGIWWRFRDKTLTDVPAMSWFRRFLCFQWIELWRIRNWLLHGFPGEFYWWTGRRPTENEVLKPEGSIYIACDKTIVVLFWHNPGQQNSAAIWMVKHFKYVVNYV